MAKSIKKLVGRVFAGAERRGIPEITDIAVSGDGALLCQRREGRWVRGRFAGPVQFDQPSGVGDDASRRALVLGRQGERPVAVNVEGAGGGETGRLQRADAEALRELGFKVPPDGVIQWTGLSGPIEILLD